MGTKKVTLCHKRHDCIGCGSCSLLAPLRFQMNAEDGKADMIGSKWHGTEFMVAQIEEEEVTATRKAVDACPVSIIRLQK